MTEHWTRVAASHCLQCNLCGSWGRHSTFWRRLVPLVWRQTQWWCHQLVGALPDTRYRWAVSDKLNKTLKTVKHYTAERLLRWFTPWVSRLNQGRGGSGQWREKKPAKWDFPSRPSFLCLNSPPGYNTDAKHNKFSILNFCQSFGILWYPSLGLLRAFSTNRSITTLGHSMGNVLKSTFNCRLLKDGLSNVTQK